MNLMTLDLNLLRVLEALHVHGKASTAAEALGISQPAVSNALRRLRDHFGDELFTRTPQGMVATPIGAQVAGAAAQALTAWREGLDPGGAFDPTSSERTFTLVMSDIGEIAFLPELLGCLQAQAPRIRIETTTLSVSETRLAMESGSVDLAVGFLPDLKTGFYQQRLFEQKYVCMVRAGHPTIGDSLSLKGFLAARHAVVKARGTGHGIVETMFERAGLAPDVVLKLPHFLAVPTVIAQTDLLVTVPQRLGEVFARMLPLRLLPHPLKIPAFQVNQYWHRRYHRDPANRWLRAHFVRLFGA